MGVHTCTDIKSLTAFDLGWHEIDVIIKAFSIEIMCWLGCHLLTCLHVTFYEVYLIVSALIINSGRAVVCLGHHPLRPSPPIDVEKERDRLMQRQWPTISPCQSRETTTTHIHPMISRYSSWTQYTTASNKDELGSLNRPLVGGGHRHWFNECDWRC